MMKRIGRRMGIRMSLLMSFALSVIGPLSAGQFTIPGFIISFIISTVISMLISLIIPIGKITNDLSRKWKLEDGTLKKHAIESLISDTIYTPIITLVMVSFAYMQIMKSSGGHAQVPFIPMFLKSLIICYIAGYILVFIFQPMFLKSIMKSM